MTQTITKQNWTNAQSVILTKISRIPKHVDQKDSAAMVAAKRSAGVTQEESIARRQENTQVRDPPWL